MFRQAGLCVLAALLPAVVLAQTPSDADLQKRANAVLTLMGFSLSPDVTTGSLSISDQSAGNPYFRQTSVSGGGTAKSMPLYLEGTLAYGRYDPTFNAGSAQGQPPIPVKWDSLLATGGIGWDFPVAPRLVLRPIANVSLGRVESEGSGAPAAQLPGTGSTLDFLSHGELNAAGLGGALMLDYERYLPENEIDAELRYSSIHLQSFQSSNAVQGHSLAQTFSFWSRYRAPSGLVALERPVRYVLEYAYSRFLGDLEGALGFTYMHSFGLGLELDTSRYDSYVTRTRLLLRYKAGNNVTGWAIGLAVSF
jgi:hypothetical protein